jgi:hypothetical protein
MHSSSTVHFFCMTASQYNFRAYNLLVQQPVQSSCIHYHSSAKLHNLLVYTLPVQQPVQSSCIHSPSTAASAIFLFTLSQDSQYNLSLYTLQYSQPCSTISLYALSSTASHAVQSPCMHSSSTASEYNLPNLFLCTNSHPLTNFPNYSMYMYRNSRTQTMHHID